MLGALRATALLVHLVRASANIAQRAGSGVDFFGPVLALLVADEPVTQALFTEIALLVRDPIVQTPMWTDDEFGHGSTPLNGVPCLIFDRRGRSRNRSILGRPLSAAPVPRQAACPVPPVTMDINEINSNVTASNQFRFFIGGLRDEYA